MGNMGCFLLLVFNAGASAESSDPWLNMEGECLSAEMPTRLTEKGFLNYNVS